ncbi:hypothetical protein KCU92_g9980, partial [Aureobasidium melanogenum]
MYLVVSNACQVQSLPCPSRHTRSPFVFRLCDWGWQRSRIWDLKLWQAWRINGDIKPYWNAISAIIEQVSFRYWATDFYGRNDMVIMEAGNTGQGSPQGNLTYEEPKNHFTAWALMKSPLVIGTDLNNATHEAISILGITTKGYLDKAPGDALPILRRLQEPTDWQQNPTLSSFAYQFMSTFRSKFKAIRVYQALVPRLIANHGELLRPMLRNPNLRTGSIFVDSKDSSKITGFIDWQCSEIVPAYKQIQQPIFHIASKSNGSKSQEAPKSSSQTVFELFASLGETERPDVIQQLAFRNSIEYTLLEQAEDMLNTDSTEFLALAEEYLKLHPKYVSSFDDLLMSHPRRRRYLKQKPRQEYIAEQLSLYKKG